MTSEFVQIERRPNGVAVLTLTRPPMNALSRALLSELADVAERLHVDPDLKAVVITGAGRSFAAGAEISEFGDQIAAAEVGRAFRLALDFVAAIPRPVIAAINGFALGGGLELALACDLRIAADSARVGQPEILLGIIPGGGGTQRLTRLVGPAVAKELVWTGRQVRADEAFALGIVNRVAPADELLDRALAWADELAAGAVLAMSLAKRAIDLGQDATLEDGLDLEYDAFIDVFATEDSRIGVESFLANGPGKATFTGR
jgi:enoyl-CoA hydratase/carnithine racemase